MSIRISQDVYNDLLSPCLDNISLTRLARTSKGMQALVYRHTKWKKRTSLEGLVGLKTWQAYAQVHTLDYRIKLAYARGLLKGHRYYLNLLRIGSISCFITPVFYMITFDQFAAYRKDIDEVYQLYDHNFAQISATYGARIEQLITERNSSPLSSFPETSTCRMALIDEEDQIRHQKERDLKSAETAREANIETLIETFPSKAKLYEETRVIFMSVSLLVAATLELCRAHDTLPLVQLRSTREGNALIATIGLVAYMTGIYCLESDMPAAGGCLFFNGVVLLTRGLNPRALPRICGEVAGRVGALSVRASAAANRTLRTPACERITRAIQESWLGRKFSACAKGIRDLRTLMTIYQ